MTTYTIKPLAWGGTVARDRWYASTILGLLMVDKTGGEWKWACFFDDKDAETGGTCESRKDGIAKAEAIYLERIKQALVPCDAGQ
jgi:hypothetical protein